MYVHKHTITVHERSHKGKWGEMSYNINNCLRLILKKLKKKSVSEVELSLAFL